MNWRENWRTLLILAVVFGAVIYTATLAPIPQGRGYHAFADSTAWASIPNAWNVVSNLAFIFAGLVGFFRLRKLSHSPAVDIWRFMFISIVLVGFGSGWYHWRPTNESLFWDRLTMSLGFAAMIAGVCADRICCKTGCKLCIPLILFSIGTVLYWIHTEHSGSGDLRPYLTLQYLSMALVPLIILLYPESAAANRPYWLLWSFYVVAKLFELYDQQIFALTGRFLSGHTLKHFAAAAGLLFFRPYPKSFCQSDFRQTGTVGVLVLCFLFLSPSVSHAATQAELDESRFLLHAMTMSVASHPGRASELLQESMRQRENWQFASYIVIEGTVEAEVLVGWRNNKTGPPDYWVAVAGSNSFEDWFLDFDTGKVNFAKQNGLSAPYNSLHVHRGFSIHTQAILNLPLQTPFGTKETLADFLLNRPDQKVVLAGHCLGGAAVVIMSTRLISLGVKPEQIRAVTFGAPTVGDKAFARHFEPIVDMTRVVTTGDPIPLVPPKALSGFVHWGKLVSWERPDLPFWERHYKKHHHDLIMRKHYDLLASFGQTVEPTPKGKVYIAAIQNELPTKWGGDDFPYMKRVLYETYRDLFGTFTVHPTPNATLAQFEQVRASAAAAGSEYVLFASIWGQRYENAMFPYTLITLDQSLYRVSDGTLVYSASYQDAARQFTPLLAVLTAATVMNQDRDNWK